MSLMSEEFVRAEMAERHRQAREARLSYGMLMARRWRRKASQARLHADRALADHRSQPDYRPGATPVLSR